MSLTYEERRHTILSQLATQGKVQVQILADLFQVSTETIRRDLDRLEKEGELRKVYGGAVRIRSGMIEAPFQKRAQLQLNEKQAIGVTAASLIEDGETVMLDNGTTTLEIMRQLRHRSQVTVITNSVPILNCALEDFAGKIIFTGGEINTAVLASTGPIAHRLLSQFKVNKAFISAGGVSLTDGITDYVLEEALISRKMMERAEEAILVADHTKFGRSTFAQIAPINQISMVITDSGCPTEWVKALHQMEIEMVHSI
ncbi:DeoR/GlpR family DNA-binding transcription regulator [Paenibacillus sp. F6_3S_P_1C]|uniref:DeoR/GlpR family DNA-binding transcription regulator n=1 Tax=Paenibacillus vandeheii TaxID=3035917 RepID=A0ABT8JH59_9BACL|nr:DeoR/GlpR family DNA-binding transcription regulator [Paenibacillus vandeheii]MDN4604168.1 DeoR/GlpR family DNA-binding transcription regulator [Paenibacillus vandeheii]